MHEEQCKKSEIAISEQEAEIVCDLFKMLGDPSRLKIVCALMDTTMCVAHLAEQVEMEQSAVSHQLKNLRTVGLVKSEKRGKQVFYSLDDEHVSAILGQAVLHAHHIRGGF